MSQTLTAPQAPPGTESDLLAEISEAGRAAAAASAAAATGPLTLIGNNSDNAVTVSRNAAGQIFATVPVPGAPTVANTDLIQVFGLGGNDVLTLNEAGGALPRASLFGGSGNDTATGGSGADMLFGQAGGDALLGRGGADVLFGGDDNDTLTGGDGDDQVFGEIGDDRFIWNLGDDTDLFEGGDGKDTAEVNGGNGAETFTVTSVGARVHLDRVTPSPDRVVDIGTTETVVLNANGGNDRVDASALLAGPAELVVNGGLGDDTIIGGQGRDVPVGGDGNDSIVGGRGGDVAVLGAGDDTFTWNPGDGEDIVEGQSGTDTLDFRGSGAGESFDLSSLGSRVRLTRDVADIVTDMSGVERINIAAVGGADRVRVGDLSGTDVDQVRVDLAAFFGSTAGDGGADQVTVAGASFGDGIGVTSAGSEVLVSGLSASVRVVNAEAGLDRLTIATGLGNDAVNANGLAAGRIGLSVETGAGDDVIIGSQGGDLVTGGQGNDVALLGAGGDTFVWNPGDGGDTVDDLGGTDTLAFNGSGADEAVEISAAGGRVRLFRDLDAGSVSMDGVERIDVAASGGADRVEVGNLSGTDTKEVRISLAGAPGGTSGDGRADLVTVGGTSVNDAITVSDIGGSAAVNGLPARVVVDHADRGGDSLAVDGGAGDDIVLDLGGAPGGVGLRFLGGAGNDALVGGAGANALFGGLGDDALTGGGGADRFMFEGGNGTDRIAEFEDGLDRIQITGYGAALDGFDDLAGAIVQAGSSTLIDLGAKVAGAGVIVLENTQATQIGAADFLFG